LRISSLLRSDEFYHKMIVVSFAVLAEAGLP
jgi:hypothetical protein